MEASGTGPQIEFQISDTAPKGHLGRSNPENLPIYYQSLYVDYQNEYHLSRIGAKSHRFLKMFGGSRLVGLAALNRLTLGVGAPYANVDEPSLELSHIVFDERVSEELRVSTITEGAKYLRTRKNDVAETQAITVNGRLSDPVMALLVGNGEFTAVDVGAELRIDLDKSEEELFTRLRKKYRQLIRKYHDTLQVSVRTDGTALDELRRLHFQVSGRTTRSSKTWEIQRQAVEEGSAFIVTISSLTDELFGALYVMHTPAEALSFSAAYDRRAMADGNPLGHLAEWEAIKFLKRNSLAKSYLLGSSGRATLENEKLANIVNFKDGFAPIYDLVGRLQYSCL